MANITANDGNYTRSAETVDGLYVFLAAPNILLSITALLSNAVILIALHKVTYIYPPTELACRKMACRKMNEDFAYARNTESGCKTIIHK